MKIAQVALSSRDMLATRSWYADCFGYLPAGGLDPEALPEPPDIAAIQGVPGALVKLVWAVDRQEFFQLELFQYQAPQARPLPADWRACDIGYTTIGMHVAHFDATLRRLAGRGVQPLTGPLGGPSARRVCVRDPDGVLLEIMEDDPRVPGSGRRPAREVTVATRMVRASVPDLARSIAFFVDTLGMRRHERTLHGPEHERLWGLEGARLQVELLAAGDFWLELAQYEDPQPAPWPDDYRISDLGILNIALGSRDKELYRAAAKTVTAAGYKLGAEIETEIGSSVYATDDQGFSVELLHMEESGDAFAGFAPEEPPGS